MTSKGKLIQFDQPMDKGMSTLLDSVRDIITAARREVLRAVDVVQVRTCWEIGRHIVEHEQNGAERANYGAKLIPNLAKKLTEEFGKGFDERNLRNMRAFYQLFPIRNAVRTELSWTHYRSLLRVELESARHWYMNEAAEQNWSSRALDRQIGTLYYERLLISRDRAPVRSEAEEMIRPLQSTPREIVRDPVMLEFLGIPEAGRLQEAKLEQALIDKLQGFLMELGKGFAFVERQQRISAEDGDYFVDLVFYNYFLKCFVLFDLKSGKLTSQDVGQMDMYVRMYDDLRKDPNDNPTVGIILCSDKNNTVAKYSILNGHEQLFASKYRTVLPTEEQLREELARNCLTEVENFRAHYLVHDPLPAYPPTGSDAI